MRNKVMSVLFADWSGDDWETQTRKKLSEVHKQAKFQLELVNVDELKEKRYTRAGHKVFMQNMRKTNKSWSDPDINGWSDGWPLGWPEGWPLGWLLG
ncbi:unnamed protein product [Effrenium voratum]|uniref:Uncharacterized protein n=1 Tax=Effrenium voratum TaxID=2562239 RepID=A0AA36MME0_9DINO|nr:unnamed protein product [Effrenium voratum]